jgi:hypothetical protein
LVNHQNYGQLRSGSEASSLEKVTCGCEASASSKCEKINLQGVALYIKIAGNYGCSSQKNYGLKKKVWTYPHILKRNETVPSTKETSIFESRSQI